MNAVIMDNVILGDECIVGALAFIKADSVFENRSLIVGNPAKKIKIVTDEMMQWKTEGTKLYQSLPTQMHESWEVCTPITELPTVSPVIENIANYKTWNESKPQ
jgi:carbonic anhydrase/acetyltransferase-like protein (isoleucine patch superfamily)